MKNYYVLLYYCYTPIKNLEKFRDEHHLFCLENNIRGRIIVASEGLNGTVSGLKEDCEKYMTYVKSDTRFDNLEFKVEELATHGFEKIHVRVKSEIVHSGFKHVNPNEKTGIHLEPGEFKKMKDANDVVILDCRSDYEYHLGKFKNAVTMDIHNFREIPEHVEELKKKYKDKKILTYCTGGIKCEKASAYLLEQGFENVYQLHGGIIKYGIEQGGEDFEGKCYVFDNRIGAEINSINPSVISECHICETKSDRMINCANPECNIHVPICESCGWKLEGTCSDECKTHPRKRDYDGTGYYQKNTNGYNPFIGVYSSKKETTQ